MSFTFTVLGSRKCSSLSIVYQQSKTQRCSVYYNTWQGKASNFRCRQHKCYYLNNNLIIKTDSTDRFIFKTFFLSPFSHLQPSDLLLSLGPWISQATSSRSSSSSTTSVSTVSCATVSLWWAADTSRPTDRFWRPAAPTSEPCLRLQRGMLAWTWSSWTARLRS